MGFARRRGGEPRPVFVVLAVGLCLLLCHAALSTGRAQAKTRFCLAVTVHYRGAGDYTYPVRILKGSVSCRVARRTLKRYMASARQQPSWRCFLGHGQDIWSATCITGSERHPRKEIRAYNPT